MKQSLLTLGAAFAFAGVSQAVFIVENFESYYGGQPSPYIPGQNLNGATNGINTWTVYNGTSGGGDNIATATYADFSPGNVAGSIGGYTPTNPGLETVLVSAAAIPMFNTTTPIIGNPASFRIDFGFYDSTTSERDHYSIQLFRNAGGFTNNLLTIDLTPAVNVNTYNISFSSDFFGGVSNWGTINSLDSAGNPFFSLEFKTGTDGIGGMFYSLKDLNANALMSDGSLTGTGLGDSITSLQISSNTLGNASGDGFLVFDNINLIPEPSSSLLGLLGLTLAVTRRRRD